MFLCLQIYFVSNICTNKVSFKHKFLSNGLLNVWSFIITTVSPRSPMYVFINPANLQFPPTSVHVAVPRDISFSIQDHEKQREGKTIYASRPAFNYSEDPKRRDAISERRCRHGFRILMGAHVKPDTAVLGPTSQQETRHSVASSGLCFVNLDHSP